MLVLVVCACLYLPVCQYFGFVLPVLRRATAPGNIFAFGSLAPDGAVAACARMSGKHGRCVFKKDA